MSEIDGSAENMERALIRISIFLSHPFATASEGMIRERCECEIITAGKPREKITSPSRVRCPEESADQTVAIRGVRRKTIDVDRKADEKAGRDQQQGEDGERKSFGT